MKRALLFSGQGAQHVGMGRDLPESSAELAQLYQQTDEILGFPLREISFHGPEEKLTQTAICQPALYVHGYALFRAAQIRVPHFSFVAAAGLSLGEYTAHAAAQTFAFPTGLRLVQRRANLMQEACEKTDGGMVSLLGASTEQAEEIAQEAQLDVANYNCPGQIVLSGARAALPRALEIAKAKGVRKALPLKVAGAYHSRLMADAEAALALDLQAAPLQTPRVAVVANYSAAVVDDLAEIRQLLARQVTGSVRWENSMRLLLSQGIKQFIEFGPGKVLAGLMKRIDPQARIISISNHQELEENAHELSS